MEFLKNNLFQDKNVDKVYEAPYPESLDADDAPPQLVSFSVSESECEYVCIFYTTVNAADGQPPAGLPLRGPPAGQNRSTGNPRTTSLHMFTFFTALLMPPAGSRWQGRPCEGRRQGKRCLRGIPYYFITYVYIFYTLVNAVGGQPPAEPPLRGPPARQKGLTGNPRAI